MCAKWYRYEDKCPGCGTKFRRPDKHEHFACVICGFMVSVPPYREPDKEVCFLKHWVGETEVPITIAHYCKMQRMVMQEVERLPIFV